LNFDIYDHLTWYLIKRYIFVKLYTLQMSFHISKIHFDIFRRSRIRSLLTYFCYGRCCLAILKIKIFSNFLIGRSSENGVKMLAVIFRLCFFEPNIGPSPNVKFFFPQFLWGKIPNSVVIKKLFQVFQYLIDVVAVIYSVFAISI
jgi:hypothetical protein